MEACREEELGAVIISVTVFVSMAFGLHLLSKYIQLGSLLFSALAAGVHTAFAAIVFLPLHRLLGAVKTVIVGFVLYAVLFTVLFSYVWVLPSFTAKIGDVYLFQGGSVTLHGVLYNFVIAVVAAALSSLAFIICFRLGFLCPTERTLHRMN